MTNKKEHIINLESNKQNKEAFALGQLLPQIFSNFAKELKPKMIACFESLDDTLFDLAEKADNNKSQTMYFESMRLVRKQRSAMFKDFFEAIKTSFKLFKQNNFDFFDQDTSANPKVKSLSLSLIDEKELDETLAKTNLINKSEMAYHRQLFAFKKRFSVLASGTELKDNHIPIGPYVIVNAFSQSIKILEVDVKLKLIIYKLFERNVMGHLNPIYTHTNNFLAEKGVVPEIQYNIGRSSGNSGQVPAPQSQNTQTNVPPEQIENTNQNMVQNNALQDGTVNQQQIDPNYQLISQLFKQNNQGQQAEQGNNSNNTSQTNGQFVPQTQAPNVNVNSMLNALSILQGEVFTNNQMTVNKSPTDIKDELIKQLHKLDSGTKKQKVKQKDEDTIDLVGMLFQFIVDDRNLPDAIQVILARLQIPYLKIALKNRNIFADKTHVARVLLDKLSLASVGWNEESDKKNEFIGMIENITNQILDMDEYKEEKYHDLNKQLDVFLNKQKKRAEVTQKRTKEKSLGQDKINQAKEKSAQILVDKMTNKPMPILIRDILLGEWANLLVLMSLRHNEDSQEFKDKLLFVDLVIQYSQYDENNLITKDDISKLSEQYQEGLKLVAFNPKELLEKQHKLVTCLNGIHKLDENKDDNTKEVELISPQEILKISEIRKQHEISTFIEKIIEPPKENDPIANIEDKFSDTVKTLKTGVWLEFIRDDDYNVRAKLSWISPITGKYLFVNSRGLKITDKTSSELVDGLRSKSIRVLKQVAIFDRALSAIANKLKTDDKPTKTEPSKKIETNHTRVESSIDIKQPK